MRFIANGPSIPDELLLARDQGRVVFFCGAGVSKAYAGLPDFFGLTKSVMKNLGVLEDSRAMELMSEAQNTTGLVSADRIFGLLERDFYRRDIYEAVAAALCIREEDDKYDEEKLSAHQTMLRLATTPHDHVQLVTTNFDRLFELCNPQLETFCPPKLPDFSLETEFNGIVYLHGKINAEGTGAEGGSFVLSSSEFGDAYLARGWATSFVKSILERYMVVFIGYSADDPPMQYLLEALNEKSSHLQHIYAFQRGNVDEARALWEHKGVTAIPFYDFGSLWDSLDLWAERAINPDAWYQGILAKAQVGPSALIPFERGQVAHIASHVEGMRKIVFAQAPLPASWLYVFDNGLRCREKNGEDHSVEQYYTDDDFGHDAHVAWDVFRLDTFDVAQITESHASGILSYGNNFSPLPMLSERHQLVAKWISQVAGQPEAVWWAVRHVSSYDSIQNHIIQDIRINKDTISDVVWTAWDYIFEFMKHHKHEDFYFLLMNLEKEIKNTGWTNKILRSYTKLLRPSLEVSSPYRLMNTLGDNAISLHNLINIEISYPDVEHSNIPIPNEWLARFVRAIRHNLEYGRMLENEVNSYQSATIFSFYSDDEQRFWNKSVKYKFFYIHELQELCRLNPDAAQEEMFSWPQDTELFAHLRIWALGQEVLVPRENFKDYFNTIQSSIFWDYSYQADLLFSIKARWEILDSDTKRVIQERLLQGREREESETEEDFIGGRASTTLNRMVWLERQGCTFEKDWRVEKQRLMQNAPEWRTEHAQLVVDTSGPSGGLVYTDADWSCLIDVPLDQILTVAERNTGHGRNILIDKQPFAGLSQNNPIRAFSALRRNAKNEDIAEWAWRTFLNSEKRKNDKGRLVFLIATTLEQMSHKNIEKIIWPLCFWLNFVGKSLFQASPDTFARVSQKVVDTIALHPQCGGSARVSNQREIDWLEYSWNSPVGKIVGAIFQTFPEEGFFAQEQLSLIEKMLALPAELKCCTVARLAQDLSVLFARSPQWTKENLISVLKSSQIDDRNAFWSGCFFRFSYTCDLFLLLKPDLLSWARASIDFQKQQKNAAAVILSVWKHGKDQTDEILITDAELHALLVKSSDMFRYTIIRHASSGEEAYWFPIFKELFTHAWPKQIVAKSAYISRTLCYAVLESSTHFENIVDLVLRFMTKINGRHRIYHIKNELVEQYPQSMLAFLDAVLPDDTTCWPSNMDSIFEILLNMDQSIKEDHRLTSLQSKWNSRRIL